VRQKAQLLLTTGAMLAEASRAFYANSAAYICKQELLHAERYPYEKRPDTKVSALVYAYSMSRFFYNAFSTL